MKLYKYKFSLIKDRIDNQYEEFHNTTKPARTGVYKYSKLEFLMGNRTELHFIHKN